MDALLTPPSSDPLVDTPVEGEAPLIKDEPWAKNLVEIIDHLEKHDQFMRDRQLKKWRKQMCYWDHLQYLWWSELAHDWRTPQDAVEEDPQADIDPALYAKVINIYRAHGEVIIAAMSASLPTVPFFPDDADNADDVSTAKAFTKIGALIQKHNFAELLFMKALYILYNQGIVFGYNENRREKQFGTYQKAVIKDHMVTTQEQNCPNCGLMLGSNEVGSRLIDEGGSQNEVANQSDLSMGVPEGEGGGAMESQAMDSPPSLPCPQCQQDVQPWNEEYSEIVPRLVGYEDTPKARECLDVYGPLNVKVPGWSTKPSDWPYLILETEEHYTKLQDVYPEIAEFIAPTTDLETWDRSMRTAVAYSGDLPLDLCTTRRVWLEPHTYNLLGVGNRDDEIEELRSLFPKGCYTVIINRDLVAEATEDSREDHWTATEHPLAETVHASATGEGVVPIQDMTNETFNLTLEGIEFGIPEVFADPDVLNFDEYGKSEARPGQVSPAKAPAGRTLSEGFFEAKTSQISREIDLFANRLERVGQFVSGALPTVFGGAIQGGTGTAREYEMSRSQALQRLQITWKIVKIWWAKMLSKAVRSFANNMKSDERYIQKKGSSFVNVWIRKADMGGKVGEVEPDVNESFPISWAAKRDMILNLIQSGNEDIMAVIRHPENASLVASLIGVPEMYVPGDDSRNKQLVEIAELIVSEPMENPMAMMTPQQGQPPQEQNGPIPPVGDNQPKTPEGQSQPPPPQMVSSVQVEPDLDDHEVESSTCQAWLRSEVGMQCKIENPGGYLNVLTHMKEHLFFVKQAQAQEMANAKDQHGGSNSEGSAPPRG